MMTRSKMLLAVAAAALVIAALVYLAAGRPPPAGTPGTGDGAATGTVHRAKPDHSGFFDRLRSRWPSGNASANAPLGRPGPAERRVQGKPSPEFLSRLDTALATTGRNRRYTALHALAQDIGSRADVDAALKVWARLPSRRDRDALMNAVVEGWAAWDPAAAAAWLTSNATQSLAVARMQGSLASQLAQTWAASNVVVVAEWISGLQNKHLRDSLVYKVVQTAGASDPVAVLEWLHGAGASTWTPQQVQQFEHGLFTGWIKKDPEAAMAYFDSLPPGDPRAEQLQSLAAAAITRTDPQRGLALIEAIADPQQRQAALSRAVTSLAHSDPAAALAYLDRAPEADPDFRLRRSAIVSLAASDPRGALAMAAALPEPDQRNRTLLESLQRWGNTDPAAALAALDTTDFGLPDGAQPPAADATRSRLAAKLAATDVGAALTALEGIADANTRNRGLADVLRAWGKIDARAALNYLDTLPDEPVFRSVRSALTRGIVLQDPRAALAAAEEALGGDRTTQILAALNLISVEAPEEALAYITAHPEFPAAASLATSVLKRIADTDIERAVALAQGLPEDRVRDTALSHLLRDHARDDPVTALGYLSVISDSALADSVRLAAVPSLAEVDFDRALELVDGMSDPMLRLQAASGLAQTWSAVSPRSAATWFFDNGGNTAAGAASLKRLMEQWAWSSETGYQETAQWISAQGTDHPTEILDVLVERLARADVERALQFAMSLPNTEDGNLVRGKALEMVIRHTATTDAARAARMMENTAVTLSPVVLSEVAFNWGRQDPAAAAAWVERMPPGSSERLRAANEIFQHWMRVDRRAALAWFERINRGRDPGSG